MGWKAYIGTAVALFVVLPTTWVWVGGGMMASNMVLEPEQPDKVRETYWIDFWRVRIVDPSHPAVTGGDSHGQVVGRISPTTREIFLEGDRPVLEMIETCEHEFGHARGYTHEEMDTQQFKEKVFPVCRRLYDELMYPDRQS